MDKELYALSLIKQGIFILDNLEMSTELNCVETLEELTNELNEIRDLIKKKVV